MLKESTSLVVGGTTGMRTWEAALYLLEWIIANPAAVAAKWVRSTWMPWCVHIHRYVSTLEHYYHAVYRCWVWSDLDFLPLLPGTLHSTMPQMLFTVGVDMFLSWALASDLWASRPCFSTHLRALPSQTVTRRCWMHWGRTYNCKVCVHTVLDTAPSDVYHVYTCRIYIWCQTHTHYTHTYSVSIVC